MMVLDYSAPHSATLEPLYGSGGHQHQEIELSRWGLWAGSPWKYTVTSIAWDRERVRSCGKYHIIRKDEMHIGMTSEASESLWVKS